MTGFKKCPFGSLFSFVVGLTRPLGYEPAGLTVHLPQNDRGWVLVPQILFPQKEVDFVGDIRIGTP